MNKVLPSAGKSAAQPTNASPSKPDTTEAQMSSSMKSSAVTGATQQKPGEKNWDAEIKPDPLCNRPQEKFDIFEKVAEVGGMEAEERLKRLIQSDYRFEDLTPEDRKMLNFIAQTTLWVPVDLERKIVAVGGVFSSKGKGSNPLLEKNRERIETRLNRIKEPLKDFPGEINVTIDRERNDGAYANFGGDIVISPAFANGMAEYPVGGDFVLAHELSHVYKRHPIKKLQFELVSTSEGWNLARKLLARATNASKSNPFADASLIFDLPKLYSVVKSMQLTFSQTQELEADACTTIWLKSIGDDPLSAWKDFVAHYAASDNVPTEYGKTHPPTEVRAENIATKLRQDSGAPTPATASKPSKPSTATASKKR